MSTEHKVYSDFFFLFFNNNNPVQVASRPWAIILQISFFRYCSSAFFMNGKSILVCIEKRRVLSEAQRNEVIYSTEYETSIVTALELGNRLDPTETF